jgi:hypothetical protein
MIGRGGWREFVVFDAPKSIVTDDLETGRKRKFQVLHDPHPAPLIERDIDRLRHIRFGGDQLDFHSGIELEPFQRFLRCFRLQAARSRSGVRNCETQDRNQRDREPRAVPPSRIQPWPAWTRWGGMTIEPDLALVSLACNLSYHWLDAAIFQAVTSASISPPLL